MSPSPIARLTLAKLMAGLSFAAPVQTLFLLSRGLDLAHIMLLESVLSAAILLFEVPTGVIGDRIGRVASLVAGQMLALAAWVPFLLAQSFALFALSFFLTGVAFTCASGSDQALVFDHLRAAGREQEMTRAWGRYCAAPIAGAALAAVVGGLAAARGGYDAVYAGTIAAQVLGLLLLLTVREAPGAADGPGAARPGTLTLLRDGVRLLRDRPALRRIALLSMFAPPFTALLAYAWQPYLQLAGVPHAWFGAALAAASLASALAAAQAHRLEDRLGTERALVALTLGPAALWGAMALLVGPGMSLTLYVATTAAGAARGPLFAGAMNRHIPGPIRATVLSAVSVGASLYALAVRPVLGALVDANLTAAFAVTGLVILLGALCFRLREGDAAPAGAAVAEA